MRRRHTLFTILALPVVALALSLTGCVDEKVVYRDRELFATPPTGAAGFLGYSKTEEKLTVCGNCHIGQQTKWQETAHADAWNTLQTSGHPQAFCEGCHTVSQLGNMMQQEGGWVATKDARYQDVQCESCHGPGLTHVQNPSKGTVNTVLAPMAAGMSLTTGCVQCHNGTHHPYGEEWGASGHGTMATSASAASRPTCRDCHTGEDALKSWGINANFAEKSVMLGDSLKNMTITCGVCHDPHAKSAGQLRFPVDVPSEEGNLCMKCHHKRGTPDFASANRGPHSPEGPVLLGYGGWWPPNMEMPNNEIIATHGSERNPKLCAGCHLNKFTVNDAQGNFSFQATGHTFEAIPCLDSNGKPVVKGNCAPTQRTYKTCTGAGCHGSEAVVRSAMVTTEMRIAALNEELNRTLQKIHTNWRTCRSNNSCGAGSPFNSTDGKYTTAEGAAFNYDLGLRKSAAIHNPFLVEALLIATIRQVKQDYNITSTTLVDLEPQLKGMK